MKAIIRVQRRRVLPSSRNTLNLLYNEDEVEFMVTMDTYKRDNRRPFPTWCEVLDVLKALGYKKDG